MKKILLGTSAIALAGAFAAPANAAEWNVRVGGYMTQYVAYASSDVENLAGEDFDGIDSKQDAEIHFIPSITLDNGIEFGANVQLEANTSGDQIDESYMFIDGAFGEINLGSENSAGYKMTYTAPNVAMPGANSGSLTAFVPFDTAGFNRGTLGATVLENNRNNDANRITYYTPRFAGLQFGASYARDEFQDNNSQQNCDVENCDIVDFGLNYVNSFGGFDLALSSRWGVILDAPQDPTVLGFGANVGFAGVTIGGSWAEQNDSGINDGQAFDAGISYETGPWGFSATWMHGEIQGSDSFLDGIAGGRSELDQYVLGINYALAQGVDVGAYGAYVDYEENAIETAGTGSSGDVDGWVIGTGVAISF